MINTNEQAFIDFAWTVWHEGNDLYQTKPPGAVFRPVNEIRNSAIELQQGHNQDAADRISKLSNDYLAESFHYIRDQIVNGQCQGSDRKPLDEHFRWTAFHQGQAQNYRNLLAANDYLGIRSVYQGTQSGNSNAKHLLAGISNAELKTMIDKL